MIGDLPVTKSSGGRYVLAKSALQEFSACLRGQIILPSDSAYEKTRRIWNGMINKEPGLIVKCRGAADVIACINLAREQDILLAVRGGGHNVAGNAVCDGGLVIDLSEMRSVRTDLANETVQIEGGAILGDVDHETFVHGLATPMGVVTATGYAGLTLHGGMGWQLRKYGLAADNVVEVDIVTAEGRLLRANADSNADLFWAIRGGGGNFGVVTSFTSRLHPMPAEVLFSVSIFALDEAVAVLQFLRDYMADAPEELMVLGAIWTAPDIPEVPPQHRGSHVLFLLGCYIGPAEEAEPILKPLRSCRPTVADLTSRKKWVDVQKFFDEDYPPGRRYYWKSTLIKELTDQVIETIVRQATTRPSLLTSIDIWPMGGAFGRVDPEAIAFGNRDVAFTINYESNWDDADNDQSNIEWTRASLTEVQNLSQSRTYLNFAGLGEDMEKMVKGSFGDNYGRLRAIKAKYDPKNLFRMNFNIGPKDKGT